MTSMTSRERVLAALRRPFASAMAVVSSLFSHAGAQNPQWLKFDPPLILSDEGFRGVKWCTLLQDVPWERDDAYTYPAACYLRRDEEFEVFGQQAKYRRCG